MKEIRSKVNRDFEISFEKLERHIDAKSSRTRLSITELGIYSGFPIIFGAILGYTIDQRFGFTPKGTLIGIGIGFVNCIYQIIKSIQNK